VSIEACTLPTHRSVGRRRDSNPRRLLLTRFSVGPRLLCRPRSERWMPHDLRFSYAGRDRSCLARTSGPDGARTQYGPTLLQRNLSATSYTPLAPSATSSSSSLWSSMGPAWRPTAQASTPVVKRWRRPVRSPRSGRLGRKYGLAGSKR
jgi:hypothetical protein